MEDEFVKENNHLAHEEARRCCKGCEMDDPSQDHHDCMMSEEEEEMGDWIYHHEMAKKFINFDKLWTVIKTAATYLNFLKTAIAFDLKRTISTGNKGLCQCTNNSSHFDFEFKS